MKLKALVRVGCMVVGALHSCFQQSLGPSRLPWPNHPYITYLPSHWSWLVFVLAALAKHFSRPLFPSVKGGNNIRHWIAEALRALIMIITAK